MDPQACFESILETYENDQYADFCEAFQNLADWLKIGGFAPEVNSLGQAYFGMVRAPLQMITDAPFCNNEFHIIRVANEKFIYGPYEFVIKNKNSNSEKIFPLGYKPNEDTLIRHNTNSTTI